MRVRHALALVLSAAALTSGCAEGTKDPSRTEHGTTTPPAPATTSPAPSWEGKEDQEDAMRRATRALNAAETEGASRVDSGMAQLADGLDKTFTATGDRPYTFDIACQAPTSRTLTLSLARGEAETEWELDCGDREADQFNIPAGPPFTARIAGSGPDTDGLVLWRLNTIAPDAVEDCEDDIEGCEG